MKDTLIRVLISMLFSVLTPDLIKKFCQKLGDKLGELVAGTETDWDDKILDFFLTEEGPKRLADMLLDFCEEYVIDTENTIDDAIVLPLCNMLRQALSIPEFGT